MEGQIPQQERGDSRTERLLEFWRPFQSRRLSTRERYVELAFAGTFVAVAVAMPMFASSERHLDPWVALLLVLTYAFASRVRLYLGAGYAMANEFVLVPMLYLLPVSLVPALAGLAVTAPAVIDMLTGRSHGERMLTVLADAWQVVGAAAVFLAFGEPDAELSSWYVLALALGGQCATDLVTSTLREWIGRGIAPSDLVRVVLSVYRIDLALAPVGLAVAIAARDHPYAFLLGAPLLPLLAALALDRRRRIAEAVARGDELAGQHARLDRTIRRIGESFASKLDRIALVNLVLRSAGEALEAECGRANFGTGVVAWAIDDGGAHPETALAAAEFAARRDGRLSTVEADGYAAMAHPILAEEHAREHGDVLVVARRGRPFTPDEQSLFGYLAQQAAVAVENIELHARLQRQATVDELTGLSNHRKFQDSLGYEFKRMRRSGRPLALVLFDIDDFKSVNDTYGHPQGDRVLQAVAAVLHDCCRATDEPARYGGEELALILPETDIDGGYTIAETVRRGVHALRVPVDGGEDLRVTISAGVSALDSGTEDPAALIQASDVALYRAKRSGKNRTERARAATQGRASASGST